MPLDCFALLAMTENGACKIFHCHCERAARAWQPTVCKARIMGILCRLIASASPRNDMENVDCLGQARAMTEAKIAVGTRNNKKQQLYFR